MFKKLKDKIAEEVKISPKLQASVQQFAQAMVSPSSSISSIQESASNDNFSIMEESEVSETPRNSPERESSNFQRIDLRGEVASTPLRFPVPRSRRSSASSMMSDVSSLFPVYESPNNVYHLQSDLESTSEVEEITGSTSHLQSISKEQLLLAYQKTQSRYHKYKGRYVDLARHFKELERQNGKIKAVLTETQDRALRKIAELKEQCALEQKAKAHLEDALRNDLEEKDHLIDTLKTKVKLLKSDDVVAAKGDWLKEKDSNEEVLVDVGTRGVSESDYHLSLQSENNLQDKIVQLESQLMQYKQNLREHEEKLHLVGVDKSKLESAQTSLASENESLKSELEAQRKREEEAALSLAENKMQVHRELESREEEAKKLKALVTKLQEELRSQKKTGMTESAASSAAVDSTSSAVIEDSGAGGDGLPLPFPATAELTQLKEVLRIKYKEVEVLVAENGKLRALLLSAKCQPGSLGPRPEDDEHSQDQEETNVGETVAGGGKNLTDGFENWMDEMVSLKCSGSEGFSHKVESNNLSCLGVSDLTTNLNGESGDLFKQQHSKREVETVKMSGVMDESSMDRKWESKCSEMRGELERLAKEKDELRELLALNVSPLESVECSDDGYRASESNVSLVESLSSVLSEKKKLKEEVGTVNARLKSVMKECEELRGLVEVLRSEKKELNLQMEMAKNDVYYLNRDAEELKQINDELRRVKDAGDSAVIKFEEIYRDYNKLKNELNRVQVMSDMEMERIKAECASEVSLALATLEGKEKELQNVRAQLQTSLSSSEHHISKSDGLMIKCQHLEEDLHAEREQRSLAEHLVNLFQNSLSKEFVSVLNDGRFIMHETLKSITSLEKEIDVLKAQHEGFNLQEEETKKVIQGLRDTYEQRMKELQIEVEKIQSELASTVMERDDVKRKMKEEQQRAVLAVGEHEALVLKKQEAESRALKAEKELKVVRELEEKAKVEAEEATYEQAAMRRSWEMQREQIESMSREIEGLKKAEGDLIKVLKEVREEAKSKEMEVKRLLEDLAKEKKSYSLSEEMLRGEMSSLKKVADECAVREEQVKKELAQVKEMMDEWKAKSEVYEKDLEVSLQERKNLQKRLESKESEAAKSSETVERLTKDVDISMQNEKELKLGLSTLNQEIDSLKTLLATKQVELEGLKYENTELDTAKKEFQSQLEVLTIDRDECNRKERELAEDLSTLQLERENLEWQLKDSKAQVEKQEACAHDLQRRLENMELEVTKVNEKELERHLVEQEKEVTRLQGELKEMGEISKELREELEQAQLKVLDAGSSSQGEGVSGNEEEEGDLLMQALIEEKDAAINRACVSEERIKSLEAEIVSLKEQMDEERLGLVEEIGVYREEARSRGESVHLEVNLQSVKEELASAKESLERSLAAVQEEAQEKAEWERRAKELEGMVEDLRRNFNVSIASQDEAHQEELTNYSEKMVAEVDYIRRQLMAEINGLREELIFKGNECEQLLEAHNKILNDREVELENLRRSLESEQEKANAAIESETSKWTSKISELEEKHREAIEALKKQWDVEKRELEVTSKVAVAAVESGTGSMSYLKRQIQAQAMELSETKRKYSSEILELRHLLSMQKRPSLINSEKSTLEDSTELEYLRNILYEYMMGKEPMVLARVIAAVVKFDDEQTKRILIKEEQKQTLLGQFGLT